MVAARMLRGTVVCAFPFADNALLRQVKSLRRYGDML